MSAAGAWPGALSAASASLKDQWMRSGLLRVGTWGVIVILVIEALMTLRQRTDALEAQAAELATSLSAHQSLLRQSGWANRKLEAQRQLQTLETMTWQAADAALVQAGLLDWARATAARSGLNVREAVASRQIQAAGAGGLDASVAQPGQSPSGPIGSVSQGVDGAALQRDGFGLWRLRLNLEYKRAPLLVFLQELYAHPKVVVVERLAMRLGSPGSTVEIELRAVSSTGGASGSRP